MKRILLAATLLGVVFGVAAASAAEHAAAPVNTTAPVVSGQPYVGKTLTTTAGAWQNNPTTYAYQWVRCDENGNMCVQISGATAKTYTPTAADVNHTLESWVTATNSAGTAGPVASKPTDVITPALPPTNKTKPTITGKPFVNVGLVADPGKYSGGAVESFSYQWERCAKATLTCTKISKATSQTYQVTKADVGQRLRVQVTAVNPFGQTTTASDPTAAITVPETTVTTTLNASTRATICCYKVRIFGTIKPARANEIVTVFGRQVDDIFSYAIVTARTDANGYWSALVTPMIQTVYTAQTRTWTSDGIWVYIHPRVGFGVRGKTLIAKITGRDSFAGSIAWVQAQSSKGKWRTIARVVIGETSVAKFHVALKPHKTYHLRIYLPRRQAGQGYLNGISRVRTVRFSH
jgi:hypothetical protein